MKNCRHCKKEFKKLDLALETSIIYGLKTYKYYTCLECLRKRFNKYRKTKKGRINTNKSTYKSIKKLQYKQDARTKIRLALKKREIVKPTKCKGCGKKVKLSAHHKDYSKPLKVDWLCGNCHRLEHRKLKQNEKIRYNFRIQGNLG